MKRLIDNSDAKNIYKLKENDKATFYSPAEERSQRRGAKQRRSNSVCQRFGSFVTVVLLEETPAVLCLRKLCEDHGFSNHWTSGQKPHLTKMGKRVDCNVSNYAPICGSWIISEFFLNHTFFSSSSLDSVSFTVDTIRA